MLIASGKSPTGEPVVFLGLTGRDVVHLVSGKWLEVDVERKEDLGLPDMTVVLRFGINESILLAKMGAKGVSVAGAMEGSERGPSQDDL